MIADSRRLIVSLVVLVAWVGITAFGGGLPTGEARPITDAVVHGIGLPFVLASVFLIAVVVVFRWNDVGFGRPEPGTLRLLWLPALFIALFVTVALLVGLPPPDVIFFILVNTMLVGFSEETMFRGVLFQGMRSRLSIWPAILTTTAIFGAVHVLNALSTGEWVQAGVQALAAFMSGILFMAILIRTRSLWPGIIVHGLWDGTLFLGVTGLMALTETTTPTAPADVEIPWYFFIAPLIFVLPNFVYGLFLMRKVARTEA